MAEQHQDKKEPLFKYKTLPSGSRFLRFSSLEDIFYYDDRAVNPHGLGMGYDDYREGAMQYFQERLILTPTKMAIIERAQKEVSMDPEFLELVYKGKSLKRQFELNRFVGNLSIPHYAMQNEKIFKKSEPGAKKQTLNMAFQVGTFVGGNYTESFVRILKTIMMCQAMNISVNIDMFDSDTRAINNGACYVVANVAQSCEKLNMKAVLAASHSEFFRITLFNGYSASGCQKSIGTFLDQDRIIKDLAPMYDVIGGNMLPNSSAQGNDMVAKILKIGLRR
jgi:hypothetical protein